MAQNVGNLAEIIRMLGADVGPVQAPPTRDPWELVLWNTVVYLADDHRRLRAWDTLKRDVGTDPEAILAASDEALLAVTRHGAMAERFAERLRECARITLAEFDGDLRPTLALGPAKASKALERFPGLGRPGAEMILLLSGLYPFAAFDSNAVRVLVRLGFGEEKSSYAATYRSVQLAGEPELAEECGARAETSLALKRHGQTVCRRENPRCEECTLLEVCPTGQPPVLAGPTDPSVLA